MVLIMNVLKSKKIVKPRGSLKDVDYDMEGSTLERGYEVDTQDEVAEDEEKNKGVGGSSKKKKKMTVDIDSDQEVISWRIWLGIFIRKVGEKERGVKVFQRRGLLPPWMMCP